MLSVPDKSLLDQTMETFDYSTLFHHNPLPNWVYDAETLDICAVNQAALDHYGYTRDEFLGLNIRDLRPPEEVHRVAEIRHMFDNQVGNLRLGVFTHRKKDGTLIQVEANGHKVELHGRPCVLVTVIDVTESDYHLRKHPDQLTDIEPRIGRESHYSGLAELKVAEILASISDAFYAVDRNWRFTYFNKEAERLLGRSADEVIGRDIWEVFPAVVGTVLETLYRRVAEHDLRHQMEYYYPGDGNWYDVSVYPSGGGVSVYFKNINERRAAAEALNKAYAEKISIIESIGDAFFTIDRDFTVTYWNHTAERLLGVNRTDLIGKNLWSVFPDAVDLPSYRYYHQVLETGHPATFEDYYGVWLEVNAYPAENGLSVFFRDITLRKTHEQEMMALNAELKRSNQQLEQFAFITSHDLQEPLRMITSFLNQLERKYADQLDERARQYIGFATDGAVRMKQIIMDLLEYSRAGHPDETALPVDLNGIITDYKVLRSRVMHEKNVVLHVPELPVVMGYKAPLTQTLHGLLDNAIKYAREGVPPEIRLQVEDTPEAWVFHVLDNGIGIEPQFHEKIFIIFQRLHNRDQYGGTGIGLAIAKKNIESWGGRIWLDSKAGEGTTFHFTLPKPDHA